MQRGTVQPANVPTCESIMSNNQPLPNVPEMEQTVSETPLTEDFQTGTANDPPLRTSHRDEMIDLIINGDVVAVSSGSTLLDALQATDSGVDVPALCSYDRGDLVGPRSECRTCMVETDEYGLVPSCSFPAEAGLTVRTDTERARETRDVNLDLVLSNHNLRCTTCGKNGRCELQDVAIENDIDHPRYGVLDDRESYEPLDDSHSTIRFDRNKCIMCTRCVDACNDVQAAGVLRVEGTGDDTRIGFQKPDAESFAESTCVSCGHCVSVCPTGSLTEKDIGEKMTLPLPGFNQRNSIGETIDHQPVETEDTRSAGHSKDDPSDVDIAKKSGVARMMAQAKRQAKNGVRDVGERALRSAEHMAEDVAASALPEGVLFDTATTVADFRKRSINITETTCGYCSVGCRFDVYEKDGEVLGVRPADEEATPVNDFSTCVKGKFGYDFVNSDNRLETPLIKEDGEFREASWNEALARVAEGLSKIQEEHGRDAVAVTASSKCTNEDVFLTQKFARQVLRTKNIDNCARLCHSSTVAGLQQTVGYGAMSNRINEDIGETDCYLITGSNTTESHPVLGTRIVQNVRDGADLFVFDPREVEIAQHADQYTQTKPGRDIAWINGLIHYIIENDLQDDEFIQSRTTGFEKLKRKVEPFTPEEVERLADVPPDELRKAAETIATADSCVFGWALGMTQHTHGTRNVLALANLALVTGHIGKPKSGLSPFRGHNNVQGGGGDMGPAPHTLPGYQDLQDEEVLDKFEEAWDVRPPDEVGLYITEVFDEVHKGNLRGMYIVGENPALSEPDIQHAEEALSDLDFLAVQDIFLTETAEHADVVLPAATFAEKRGTFTNTERRVQLVRQTTNPPGEAKPDWLILQELANEIGFDWDYDDPGEIMDEISDLVPIYGGISHDRLEAKGNGLQWPCWDEEHTGTPFLYEEEFNFEDGKARFVPADFAEPPELPDEEFPFTLSTGRVLYHWHTGTLTRRVEALMDQVNESFVTIHPETAAELNIDDGEYVRVESRRGSIVVKARVEDSHDPGVVFIPMHFARGAVNTLTQGELDPTSRIPEYKVSSVQLTPMGPSPEAETIGVDQSVDGLSTDD